MTICQETQTLSLINIIILHIIKLLINNIQIVIYLYICLFIYWTGGAIRSCSELFCFVFKHIYSVYTVTWSWLLYRTSNSSAWGAWGHGQKCRGSTVVGHFLTVVQPVCFHFLWKWTGNHETRDCWGAVAVKQWSLMEVQSWELGFKECILWCNWCKTNKTKNRQKHNGHIATYLSLNTNKGRHFRECLVLF